MDPELLIRWYEVAIFTPPLLRNHTSIDSPDQEPWAWGGSAYEGGIIRGGLLKLREELMPYIYSLAWGGSHELGGSP